MKKLSIYILFCLQLCCIAACYKDKGNYTYTDINEVSITEIDTTNGYAVFFGDTLSIEPVLSGSQHSIDPDGYEYEWSFYDQINGDRVISTEKDLSVKINELPGAYSLQYKVIDKSNQVLYHIRTNLLVRTEVYEGYMVLNNVDGKSRLDMLSYDAVNVDFNQFTDVLSKMGSSLPEQGEPYKIVCSRFRNAFNFSDSTYGIYLLTATGSTRVHPETFDWRPTYDIRYEVGGNIAENFRASNLVSDPAFYFVCMTMTSENNVYVRGAGTPIYNLPVNKYVGQPLFKASPYTVMQNMSSGPVVMFNEDNKSFAVLQTVYNSTVSAPPVASAPGEINFPTGHDLIYMTKSSSGFAYAITKISATNTYYLTKFIPGSLPVYSRPINGTDIDKASFFAVSAGPEYLFYSVEGKVYEYDLFLQTSKLMIDKGSSVISYLDFPQFSANRNPATYGQWARWLNVGYYNPAGPSDANGSLEQYSIPDANEPLVKQKSWNGFGKIKSISYRER